MEIINLYVNLNACFIEMQNNQKHQKAQVGRCDDYYNCVQSYSHLVEQYKSLSPEISRNFVSQRFDVNTLSHNFVRLETIDLKIRDLQHKMPEIRKYMIKEATNIESVVRQFDNDLLFERMDEAETWIDSILHELERIKLDRINKSERWKSAIKAIFKFAAAVIVAFFSFLWKMINKK